MNTQIVPLGMEKSQSFNFCNAKNGISILSGKRRAGVRGGVSWNFWHLSPNFAKRGIIGTLGVESGLQWMSSGNGEEDGTLADSKVAKPGVQRYLLAVEYDGTRFSGSQWQPNRRTVVGVLQDAFQNFIGQPVPVFCSSRTRISKRRPGEVKIAEGHDTGDLFPRGLLYVESLPCMVLLPLAIWTWFIVFI